MYSELIDRARQLLRIEMDWASVTAREAIQRLKRGARALDVRSPGEFEQGSLPGFRNIPILNNEHRHLVGLTYKNEGQPAAVELGLKLVTPLRPSLVEAWSQVFGESQVDERLLVCWRGGLRSKMTAEWLSEAGLVGRRVVGGYKAMRKEMLATFDRLPELHVLGGLTGSGKTEFLRRFPVSKVLDLELYANHRGSSFGRKIGSPQPAQQSFENAIGLALFEPEPVMLVEAESRLVGQNVIPTLLKEAMDASPLAILECSTEERIERIYQEYVVEPLALAPRSVVLPHLRDSLARLEKRLGGLRTREIMALLQAAFLPSELNVGNHAAWIECLLREYYDPQYEYAFSKKQRKVAFRGDAATVKAYLTDRLDRRRT